MQQEMPSRGKLETIKSEKGKNGGVRARSGRKPFIDKLTGKEKEKVWKLTEARFWVEIAEEKAMVRLNEILDAPLAQVGSKALLTAVKEVLDRALGKPKESHRFVDGEGNDREVGVLMYPSKKDVD